MNDRIFIDNLRCKSRVGVTDEERREPQEVLVDISLRVSLKRAGTSDNLGNTLDYREMMKRVLGFVSGNEFKLLERLAEGIASLALERPCVEGAVVKVRKAKYSNKPSIGIEIERVRGEV